MRRSARSVLRLAAIAVLALAALVAGIVAWASRADEPHAFDADRARGVSVGSPHALVPGPGLPPNLVLGAANNNLEWLRHGDRSYLGLRTAPRHWASDDARMLVLSTAAGSELDLHARWDLEVQFDLANRDLREPRFLALGERLLFYFFAADSQPGVFSPDHIHVSERLGPGRWSEPQPILEPGLVVWRTIARNGRAWMSVYDGRELYAERGRTSTVRLLQSEDGLRWTPASAGAPIAQPGGSECAFELDDAGNLVALVRVEPRGALVCTAPHDRLERWDCTPTPYRHDSPLLVRSGDRFFALARRSLGGPVERMPRWLPGDLPLLLDQLRYWWTRLRTTVYEVLPAERRIVPLLDLPSRGDTAFASVIPLGAGRFALANYTSPLDEPDWPWAVGQNVETRIIAMELVLPESAPAASAAAAGAAPSPAAPAPADR